MTKQTAGTDKGTPQGLMAIAADAIRKHCSKHGYDGVYSPDGNCCCTLDSALECGDLLDCTPGYQGPDLEGDMEFQVYTSLVKVHTAQVEADRRKAGLDAQVESVVRSTRRDNREAAYKWANPRGYDSQAKLEWKRCECCDADTPHMFCRVWPSKEIPAWRCDRCFLLNISDPITPEKIKAAADEETRPAGLLAMVAPREEAGKEQADD